MSRVLLYKMRSRKIFTNLKKLESLPSVTKHKEGLIDYLDNSSIHGLRYLTEPGRHWTERLFWALICAASIYGTYKLLLASWDAFQNNAVSFVSETAYLDWNTTFPAVSVCETENPDKLYETAARLFGVKRNRNLDFYLRDIVFFDGTCRSCATMCNISMQCSEDFQALIDEVRAPCNKLLLECRWNDIPFDCCSTFLPVQTEVGMCYVINSLHHDKLGNGTKFNRMKLYSNKVTGPGVLEFTVGESVKFFIHAAEDIPYFNHPQDEKDSLFWGLQYVMTFQVTEIENDPLLESVSIAQRNCRFPEESDILKMYSTYSYSTCIVECHSKYQMEFCNCTSHFMIKKDESEKQCDVAGLACLHRHSEELRALKSPWSTKPGLPCECLSSCSEPEYSLVSKSSRPNDEDEPVGTKIRLEMDGLPSTRFRRNVVRSRLDLVVSMGGTAGLFLGASLLTLVELFYYTFRKKAKKEESPGNSKPHSNTSVRQVEPASPSDTSNSPGGKPPTISEVLSKHIEGHIIPIESPKVIA